MTDIIADALSAMAAVDLSPGSIEFDGKIHRFQAGDDKRGQKNGWYWAIHDHRGAVVVYGSWKSSSKHVWTSGGGDKLDAETQRELKRAQEARRRAEKRRQARAAKRYAGLYNGAAKPDAGHAYLKKKSVAAYGLKQTGKRLLVPMRDSETGHIISVQAIAPNGFKRFARGGRVKGAYHGIGKPNGGRLIITEGYATGATLHEVTGAAVVVAFNAGNLEPVAKAMRKRFPESEIIVAADNDQWSEIRIGDQTVKNPGLYYADRAARSAGGRVALPIFSDLSDKPTDFNDLYAREGAEAILRDLDRGPIQEEPDTAKPETTADAQPSDTRQPEPPAPVVTPNGGGADYMTPLPWANDKGKPKRHIDNLREICRRMGVIVRYNEITKEDEILIPHKGFSRDNFYNASHAWLESLCSLFDLPHECVRQFITALADENLYNPVRSWITEKPWDGEDRLSDFFATVTAKGEDHNPQIKWLKESLVLRWMLSGVAAAFSPNGVAARGVLVFQGPQSLGKTNWFKNLVPQDLELTKDGMLLRPDNKDSVLQVCSFWLVELGELDSTFRRSDIAALKAFITNDKDVLRRAYAPRESHYSRRTVFFASVNPKGFLHDQTGNTRYWTIECEHINHTHGLDMQQVWAQVYEQYKEGEPIYLTQQEMEALNASNEDFVANDPIEERLGTRYDWEANDIMWRWMTSTDVLSEIGFDRPTRADATTCGTCARKLNGGKSRRSNGASLIFMPPLKS